MTERTARCGCGGLSAKAVGEPLKISACHCVACRHRTGSAFGVAVFYRGEAVAVSGASTVYRRLGDSGMEVEFHFCPICGSTVFWRPAFRPGLIGLAYGCFGEDAPAAPHQAVYEERRLNWVHIDLSAA